jgi:hypothetical protein
MKSRYLILILVGFIVVFFLASGSLENAHQDEIKRVLSEKKAKVIKIEKVTDKKELPFETTSYNVVYKIRYELNGESRIAWYRGTKTANDIHSSTRKGLSEKWLF